MRNAAFGALAGLAGGLVFGAVMAEIGFLPTVAAIVRTDSSAVGFAVHLLIAAIVGSVFGKLVAHQRELLFWGLSYGVLWWFLGPLTLLPVLLGEPVAWDVATARDLIPSLFGHLAYGASTAAGLALLSRKEHRFRLRPGLLARASAAWLLVAPVLGLGWRGLLVGALAGASYALIFGDVREGSGPALIRGAAFGFVWWVLAAVTVAPLLDGDGLRWSAAAVRSAVADLPGYVLLGAGAALLTCWLGGLSRAVFSDDVRHALEGRLAAGGRVISIWHGVVAGLAGGAAFTGVMVAVGFLPTVASLVGSGSAVVGLVVHLLISQIVGVTYAVFFRRRSFDPASAIGWGVSYGFLWWILGNLTLLPLLLGAAPRWSASALAESFPSLVGHLAYGAVLGLVYQRLEERVSPWHLTRSDAAAARATARHAQTLSAAPALWSLITCVALLMPILVS
ncbi:hypothetical protein OG946_24860 [Streptomyces sp. NBC_01808]|uniref:hypothetical protein n=1 Tax=Streptomyces sp. NBC_01808 TaxID=2975947 RepID=UPI002DD885DB|nr:hypothetical protein [Streptomyces sp. NBC_01808]WSA40313.1 hypothetical protein OG946_24860 [Streptomyces sp. NBC_01808]